MLLTAELLKPESLFLLVLEAGCGIDGNLDGLAAANIQHFFQNAARGRHIKYALQNTGVCPEFIPDNDSDLAGDGIRADINEVGWKPIRTGVAGAKLNRHLLRRTAVLAVRGQSHGLAKNRIELVVLPPAAMKHVVNDPRKRSRRLRLGILGP